MPKLTKEERERMLALLAEDDAEDEDFEVEIFAGDRGARVPYSRAKGWLSKEFGIGLDDDGQQSGSDDPKQPVRSLSLWRNRQGDQGQQSGSQGQQGGNGDQGRQGGQQGQRR